MNNPLRNKRKQLGYSLQEISDKIGVSKMIVSDWERNKKFPMLDKLIIIQNAYEMNNEELLEYIKFCYEESGK